MRDPQFTQNYDQSQLMYYFFQIFFKRHFFFKEIDEVIFFLGSSGRVEVNFTENKSRQIARVESLSVL